MRYQPKSRKVREAAGRAWLDEVGITVSDDLAAVLFDDSREKGTGGGWQAGKSVHGGAEVFCEFPWLPLETRSDRDPFRYWYIVPSYQDPGKELDYLAQWSEQVGILSSDHDPENGARRMTMYGGRVVVESRTGQNIPAISGEPCDGVVVVEAGQQIGKVRDQVQGRIVTRDGWAAYTGTIEEDDAHPRFAWWQEFLAAHRDKPKGSLIRCFNLPTWANPIYSGPDDPRIVALCEALGDEDLVNLRVRGIPIGVQNQVYKVLANKRDRLVRPLPWRTCEECSGRGAKDSQTCGTCKGAGRVLPWRWVDGAMGIDWGVKHIAAITLVLVNELGQAWVMHCKAVHDGDADSIASTRLSWMDFYGFTKTGIDPLQSWVAALSGVDTIAVKMGEGSREGRIGLTRRRLIADTLYFNAEDQGVHDLVTEMLGVRFVVNSVGQLVLRRENDDRTASLEDAIEVLDAGEDWSWLTKERREW